MNFNNLDSSFAIYRGRNYKVAKKLEETGLIVFNNDLVSKLANDKYETYKFLKSNNIGCLKTYKKVNLNSVFPMVAKTRNGHGGNEVFLCNSFVEVQYFQEKYDNLVFQKFIKEANKDIRVYVLGNKPVVAIERTANESFKSNYSLGGKVQQVKVTREMISICKKIRRLIKSDFIGIDFFIQNGKCIVNEIEDPVGCRMVYKCTDIDLINQFVNYCVNILKRI